MESPMKQLILPLQGLCRYFTLTGRVAASILLTGHGVRGRQWYSQVNLGCISKTGLCSLPPLTQESAVNWALLLPALTKEQSGQMLVSG